MLSSVDNIGDAPLGWQELRNTGKDRRAGADCGGAGRHGGLLPSDDGRGQHHGASVRCRMLLSWRKGRAPLRPPGMQGDIMCVLRCCR